MYLTFLIITTTVTLFWRCDKNPVNGNEISYDSIPIIKPVVPIINEISGIADSKSRTKSLWAHEDSGNPPQLFLIMHDGKIIQKVYIKGIANRDWEDMVLAGDDIYIADIGDNNSAYSSYTIYRFNEPAAGTDTVSTVAAIKFQYPDGAHDAEALLVDPTTKDIYIITKRDNPARIYKMAYPYSLTETNTVQLAGTLPYTGVVSAALSSDANKVVIKTYGSLYHYSSKAGASIAETIQQNFIKLPYQPEPQGEAITFASDGSGYFTLSEKGFSPTVNLYFYKRK